MRQCISFPQWSNFNCNLYTRPIRPYSRGRINDRIVNWKVTGTLIKYRSSGGDVSHTSPPVCIWANRIRVSPKKFFPLSSTSTFLHLIFFFIPSTSKVFLNYLPQIYDYMTFLSPKGFFFFFKPSSVSPLPGGIRGTLCQRSSSQAKKVLVQKNAILKIFSRKLLKLSPFHPSPK